MSFTEVLARLDDGEPALDAALARWRLDPHPLLGDLVDEVSRRVRGPARPELASASEAAQQAWLERAARAGSADVPALLETLAATNMHAARARIAALARRPVDPRVEGALVGLLETVPFDHKQSRPLWADLFAVLRDARDPRILSRLERLDGHIAAPDRARMIRGRLRAQVAELLQVLRPRLGGARLLEPEHAAIHDTLAAVRARPVGYVPPAITVARPAAERAAPVLAIREALLAAVYASPEDDAPRMVFADAMLERGDPRGEFVALQLRGDQGAVARRREKEMLASHRKAWLGELAPLVRRCEFERGFLAVVDVIAGNRELVRRLAGAPSWGTVHTLTGSAIIALHPVMRALRTLGFDARAAAEVEGHPAAWEELLLGDARPVETLRYGVPLGAPGEATALASCRALPQLRALSARAPRTSHGPMVRAWAESLITGTAARRIGELELVFAADVDAPFAVLGGLLERAIAPSLRLTIDAGSWRLACTLAASGTVYGAAHVELGGSPDHAGAWGGPRIDAILHAVAALPASALGDVDIAGMRIIDDARTRIDAAVVRRGGRCRFG